MQNKVQIKAIPFYDLQRKMFWVLVFCIAVTSILYICIVAKTTINIVDRRASERSAKEINSYISSLESRYIALGQEINLSDAEKRGFSEIAKIDYVSRSATLTMRDNER